MNQRANQQMNHLAHHLKDEEFADVLLGSASLQVHKHLASCEQCSSELAAAREGLVALRQATGRWSEQYVPARVPARLHVLSLAMVWRQASGVLVAAMLVLAVFAGVRVGSHARSGGAKPAVVQASQIAQDNQLLGAVNSELAEEVAPSMQPLMTESAATSTAKESGSATSQVEAGAQTGSNN